MPLQGSQGTLKGKPKGWTSEAQSTKATNPQGQRPTPTSNRCKELLGFLRLVSDFLFLTY